MKTMTTEELKKELKADLPQTTWGKILSATPVVMAVIATMLAGLASSEMTKAQYDRSLAAQQQSKAGDQWSFFQAKKLRGAMQRSTLDVLQGTADVRPMQAEEVASRVSEDRRKTSSTPESRRASRSVRAIGSATTSRSVAGRWEVAGSRD